MNKKREYPDAEDGNPFLDLSTLLRNGIGGARIVSVATLASAIENFGIYTWDEYGRFRRFEKGTPPVDRALGLLAWVYKFEHTYQSGDEQHPLDVSSGEDDPFWALGWASEVAPDFGAIKAGQLEDRKPTKSDPRKENAYLNIIGALLEYIEGRSPGVCRHPAYTGVSDLTKYLDEKYKGYYGVSESNLSRKFPEAKRSLENG